MGNRSNFRAASALVLIVAGLGAAFGACTQYKSANGESCLKDEDCLAGSCVSGTCEHQSSSGTTADDAAAAAEDAADSASDATAPADAPAADVPSGASWPGHGQAHPSRWRGTAAQTQPAAA